MNVIGVRPVAARKLAPIDSPVVASVTSTRCTWLKSMATGVPAAPACIAETVNWWLVAFHVPPDRLICSRPAPRDGLNGRVRSARGDLRAATTRTVPLFVIVWQLLSRLPRPTSTDSTEPLPIETSPITAPPPLMFSVPVPSSPTTR